MTRDWFMIVLRHQSFCSCVEMLNLGVMTGGSAPPQDLMYDALILAKQRVTNSVPKNLNSLNGLLHGAGIVINIGPENHRVL